MEPNQIPPISVSVELDRLIWAQPGLSDMLPGKLAEAIGRELEELLAELGIPGVAQVKISEFASPQGGASPPLRVRVQEKVQPFPRELFRQVWEYFSPAALGALPPALGWRDCLRGLMQVEVAGSLLRDFLAALVIEIIKLRPDRLFTAIQAEAYLKLHGAEELGAAQVVSILAKILRVNLSLAQGATILQQIQEGIGRDLSDEDIAESMVPLLRPGDIRIKMHPDDLRAMVGMEGWKGPQSVYSTQMEPKVREAFSRMADELFFELGLRSPDILLVPSTRVRANGLKVRINHLPGSPCKVLPKGRILVNAHPDDLGVMGIAGDLLINPAYGYECSVVDSKHETELAEAGNGDYYIWDPLGYLVLVVFREMRTHGWRQLDVEAVEYEMARVHEACPDLVLAAMKEVGAKGMTRLLRDLLREQVSVRDLKNILEATWSFDFVIADTRKCLVLDCRMAIDERLSAGALERLPLLLQHVRSRLKQYLSHKVSRGNSSLAVWLLSEEIEERILDHLAFVCGAEDGRRLTDADEEAILAGVRRLVLDHPVEPFLPPIVTTGTLRIGVRKLLAGEFPQLEVLSWDEVAPIPYKQAIATIGLEG